MSGLLLIVGYEVALSEPQGKKAKRELLSRIGGLLRHGVALVHRFGITQRFERVPDGEDLPAPMAGA